MEEVDKERQFWETRAAAGLASAIDAIGPASSAWHGEQLERDLLRIERAILVGSFAKPFRVLDLGCGIGRLAIPFAQRNSTCTVVGVDISESMLELARSRTQGAGPPAFIERLKWLLGDGRTLPSTEPFHGAYSAITLQHIPRDAAASYIKQIGERLVPGGAFIFQTLEGTGGDFLWNEMTVDFVREACRLAGLALGTIERVKPDTADNVSVLWVPAVKL